MKYLFFDIECSNCYGGEGKICEFGYVLTDENFKVLKKDDIPMSPGDDKQSRFDKNIYKRDPNFRFAYEYDYYFSCDKFPKHYSTIKRLFEDENTLVFGYSVDNDIRFLNSEFKRYKLKPFHYKVCDIQIIMKYYSEKRKRFTSLEHAFKELCGVNEFVKLQPHLSRDDAIMAMRVLQEMIKNLELSVNDMFELCPDSLFDTKEYLEQYEKRRKEKAIKQKQDQTRRKWNKFCELHIPFVGKEESKGKICTISATLKTDEKLLDKAIKFIKDNNLVASNKTKGSDIFLVLDEEDKQRLISIFKKPYEGQFVLLNK